MDQEFKPSASRPIASIIKHFNLPELPAYKLAHILLMQDVTDQEEDTEGEYLLTMREVFGKYDINPNERAIVRMMENEMRKHRGMRPE